MILNRAFYQNILKIAGNEKSKINEKEYEFFLVDRYLTMVEFIDKFSKSCEECNGFKNEIQDVTEELSESINSPGSKRKRYEFLNKTIAYHLRIKHKVYPKKYFTSLYVLFGIIAGVAIGLIISFTFYSVFNRFILVFLVFGFIFGIILGNLKDKKISKNKLQI